MSEELTKPFVLTDTPPVTTPRHRAFVFTREQVRDALVKAIEAQGHDTRNLTIRLQMNEHQSSIIIDGG